MPQRYRYAVTEFWRPAVHQILADHYRSLAEGWGGSLENDELALMEGLAAAPAFTQLDLREIEKLQLYLFSVGALERPHGWKFRTSDGGWA